jgi:pyruvate,water dikinase
MEPLVVPLSSPEATDAGRFGPKAANQAALGRAGLPIPDGFCVDARAYRMQLAALGLEDAARAAGAPHLADARRELTAVRLGLYDQPIVPALAGPLLAAWRALADPPRVLGVVRSSALLEDRPGTSFAGQFETFLGLEDEADFLTAVRACWAALWSTRALRYLLGHGLNPADTAMALLIQPLVPARASGGGLSRTADGGMLLSATWGLGSAIAQGEVVPDRYTMTRAGALREVAAGRKDHAVGCSHGTRRVSPAEASAPCLDDSQAVELAGLLLRAEERMGGPVEIEWAQDESGFKLLQARPLQLAPAAVPDELWLRHPGLTGHPSGIGWGAGRACVVNCECELSRVAPGDVLVTRVAGPALSQVLPRVAGVVAELGGSTSHLASLARERGIPMVLGVLEATLHIPDGAQVAVDGVAGIVRWVH